MLYIINSILILIWVIYLIKKQRYSWHGILFIYFLSILVVDIPEIIFSSIFTFYEFRPHFFSNHTIETELALLFCDGIILPLTAIIFCHYASRTKKHWKITFVFTILHFVLEEIYLALDFLKYHKWNIWFSVLLYFVGFRIAAFYSSRMIKYTHQIPYSIRIAAIIYAINAWIGGVIGGAFLGLYQWRPFIFKKVGGDERFCDLSIGLSLAVLAALIIPRIEHVYRIWFFMLFALIAVSISMFAYWKGWFFYHSWNHFLTVVRWFVPFFIIALYDRWEDKPKSHFKGEPYFK